MTQSNILLSSLLIQSRNEYTEGKEEKELADQTSFKAFIFYWNNLEQLFRNWPLLY